MVTVLIDPKAGFCPGVSNAINKAENLLDSPGKVFSLGELVHCPEEISRLELLGLRTITKEDIDSVSDSKILIRAHGVSPNVQHRLNKTNNEIADATCGTVYRLQQKVKISSMQMRQSDGQVVIYGKENHPEVEGLIGYCHSKYVIAKNPEDIENIDINSPISIFAQTTANVADFEQFVNNIYNKLLENGLEANRVQVYNTICTPMKNRVPQLRSFAKEHDVIVFVAGEHSSNGNYLYSVTKKENNRAFKVSGPGQVLPDWFDNVEKIGVSGGNSTPIWLLEEVADEIKRMLGR